MHTRAGMEDEAGFRRALGGWRLGLSKTGRDWCRDVVRIEAWNRSWQGPRSWHGGEDG